MKKIILFSLIIVSFYLNGSLNAQINIGVPDSLNTLQNTERVHSNMNLNNSAMIQQVGNFNEAIINQSNNNGFIPNIAEINQIGNNNFALSGQNGNSNFLISGNMVLIILSILILMEIIISLVSFRLEMAIRLNRISLEMVYTILFFNMAAIILSEKYRLSNRLYLWRYIRTGMELN